MAFSKRTVQNLGYPYAREYFGIDLERWAPRNVPDHAQSTDKLVITWAGDGTISGVSSDLAADDLLSTTYDHPFSNPTVFHAISPRLVFDYSGPGGTITMNSVANMRMYRLGDEADFLAGKVFRRDPLQLIVDLQPSSIRFMNWMDVNNAHSMRWENRSLPTDPYYVGSYSQPSGNIPTYGTTSGVNQMTLAAIGSTPVAMQHGEVVECTIGSSAVRNGAKTITAITKANPGSVNAVAHGFNTGDIIVHNITAGMTQLNNVPCTITKTDADNYTVGVNTTAFTTFTAGVANQYITLNVGARGRFPVVFEDGSTPASNYGNGYIAASDIKAFYFDKTMVASTEVTGAWIFNNGGSNNHHNAGVPMEICVKFMVELNALAAAQGKGPIHMGISAPHRGLLSMDPDYSAGSNCAVGMVDVALSGANGYPGLPSNVDILLEHSNETWNTAFAYPQTQYMARRGFLRWGGSTADYDTFSTLRSCVMAHDVRAAFPGNSRIKLVLSGWQLQGVSNGNDTRINGSATLDGDATYIALGGGDPIDYHDCFANAAYMSIAGQQYEIDNLATLAASYAAATTGDAREALCQSYVDALFADNHGSGGVTNAINTTQTCAAAMVLKGKVYINYEGGWDRDPTSGTTAVNTFLAAVKRSRAWSAVTRRFLAAVNATAGAYMPALPYQMVSDRWGDATPDTWANGVEGGNLAECWHQVRLHNNAKRRMYVGWGS